MLAIDNDENSLSNSKNRLYCTLKNIKYHYKMSSHNEINSNNLILQTKSHKSQQKGEAKLYSQEKK